MHTIIIQLSDGKERRTLANMRTAALPRPGDHVQLPDEVGGNTVCIDRVLHFPSVARSMDIRMSIETRAVFLEASIIPPP